MGGIETLHFQVRSDKIGHMGKGVKKHVTVGNNAFSGQKSRDVVDGKNIGTAILDGFNERPILGQGWTACDNYRDAAMFVTEIKPADRLSVTGRANVAQHGIERNIHIEYQFCGSSPADLPNFLDPTLAKMRRFIRIECDYPGFFGVTAGVIFCDDIVLPVAEFTLFCLVGGPNRGAKRPHPTAAINRTIFGYHLIQWSDYAGFKF